MTVALRAALFNLAFALWTVVLGIACLPVLLGPPRVVHRVGRLWVRGTLLLLRWIVGLEHEVRGRLADGPAIYACKHQSAWETLALTVLVPDCAFVLKRELYWVPLVGWYLARAGMIAVDRKAGMKALKALVEQGREVLADRRPIVIFPEGTRTAPGQTRPYHPGVAALYEQLGVDVVPVALNSGHFWPRRSFLKRPGRISVAFLEPIPAGLPRKAFMTRLSEAIEASTAELAPAEGVAGRRLSARQPAPSRRPPSAGPSAS